MVSNPVGAIPSAMGTTFDDGQTTIIFGVISVLLSFRFLQDRGAGRADCDLYPNEPAKMQAAPEIIASKIRFQFCKGCLGAVNFANRSRHLGTIVSLYPGLKHMPK